MKDFTEYSNQHPVKQKRFYCKSQDRHQRERKSGSILSCIQEENSGRANDPVDGIFEQILTLSASFLGV